MRTTSSSLIQTEESKSSTTDQSDRNVNVPSQPPDHKQPLYRQAAAKEDDNSRATSSLIFDKVSTSSTTRRSNHMEKVPLQPRDHQQPSPTRAAVLHALLDGSSRKSKPFSPSPSVRNEASRESYVKNQKRSARRQTNNVKQSRSGPGHQSNPSRPTRPLGENKASRSTRSSKQKPVTKLDRVKSAA